MRVDEGRGQDSTAATAESPLSAPLIPCVVSRYTSVHYRGAGGAARSLWAGAQPTNPESRMGGVVRFGEQESLVGCLLFLLYTVQCWEIISFVGKCPSLPTLPPSITSVYRVRLSRDNCGANFPSLAPIPTRDGGLCMLPMQCLVYTHARWMGRASGIDVEASSTRAQAQIEA